MPNAAEVTKSEETLPTNLMKNKRRRVRHQSSTKVLKLAALGGAGLGLACGAKAQTTITFEGFTEKNTPIATIPGYGDNVVASSADYQVNGGGTPNVTLDWLGRSWDSYIDWNGRGSVAQSDFNGGDSTLSILFAPSSAFSVRLLSFELDEWAGGGAGSINWSLTGASSGLLASGVWNMTDAGGRSLISPGTSGHLGEALTLSLQLTSGAGSYFALDNLTFAQVPEPSVLGLGAAGAGVALGAIAMRRRRRG